MKRISIIICTFLIVLSILLTSCSSGVFSIFDSEKDIIVELFSALEQQDKDAVYDMFSKNTINSDSEFDKKIDELFDFIEGDLVSYDDWGGPGEDLEFNDEYKLLSRVHSFDVTTTKQKYRIAIKEYVTDTADPDNVGICSLYIIKAEDDPNVDYSYGGDSSWTPGIHFNVVWNDSDK